MFSLLFIIAIWVCYALELTIIPTQETPVSLWFPITGTIFMIILHWIIFRPQKFKPCEPNICPICKKTMVSCVGRADPIIDPGKTWDAIHYCPECIDTLEYQELCEPK